MGQNNSAFANDMAYLAAQTRLPTVATVAVRIAVQLSKWMILHRTRQSLSTLPDYLLDDVGLTRTQAHREARRVFWNGEMR